MAEYVFPFASVDGDRMYSDVDFALFYNTIFTNGVVALVGDKLKVEQLPNAAMKVRVLPGAILIQGRQYLLTESIELNVTPGSSTADRVDIIVAQLNMLERKIKLVYKQGTTSLTRNENIWEMQLATLNVPRNTTAIYNANIKDTRSDTAVCGYSIMNGALDVKGVEQQYHSLLQQALEAFKGTANTNKLDLQQLLTDQQATFQSWLTNLQTQLDGDVAGNLQNQISKLTATDNLITITHNMGEYPNASILYWEYGLGTVALEEQPEGISWDGTAPETIAFTATHPSRSKIQLKVPTDKAMTNPKVESISSREVLLTEGVKSILVRLQKN